jgi:hypothetical protein
MGRLKDVQKLLQVPQSQRDSAEQTVMKAGINEVNALQVAAVRTTCGQL